MSMHAHHENHHRLITERVDTFRSYRQRTAVDRHRRREAFKKAAWTLQGHLSCCHGYRHVQGPALGLEELERLHAEYHAAEEVLAP